MVRTVFFSYSHKDESLRDELEIHLSVLKRQGAISTWHDRRILAGGEIDGEISEYLEAADIILLLVSPHFLASSYINDVELKRALERHEEKTAFVIPVILHPCDWHHAPFGKLLACPKDGKPVSKHPNINDAFLDITQNIRRVIDELQAETSPTIPPVGPRSAPVVGHAERSSNLRLQREFSDRERDDLLDSSMLYISAFFENSLAELEKRNEGTESRFADRGDSRFSAAIYIGGEKKASCSVWLGDGQAWSQGICFSHGDSTYSSGFNEGLSVESDGYTLGLKSLGMAVRGGDRDTILTKQGAAEYFWSLFIEQLQ